MCIGSKQRKGRMTALVGLPVYPVEQTESSSDGAYGINIVLAFQSAVTETVGNPNPGTKLGAQHAGLRDSRYSDSQPRSL